MAKEQALRIDQDSRFQYVIGVTGMTLTGLSAKMQIRPGKGNSIILLDMSQYVTVDSVGGQVVIDMPASATTTADWSKGRYDIKLLNQGNPSVSPVRILQGDVTLDQKVTV